jgi:hypothetical protein
MILSILNKPTNYRKVVFSRCLPDVASTANAVIQATGVDDLANDIVADIKLSWKEILCMSLIAVGEFKGCALLQSKMQKCYKKQL